MKSHQLVRSYSPSLRSLHEVRICQTRAPKKARSSGVRSGVGVERQQNVAQQSARVAGRERKACRRHEVGLHVLREPHPRGRRQMIRSLSPIERGRAAHGVDDMFVETGEEPEPMFAWQPMLDRAHGAGRRADVRSCPRRHRRRECCGPCLPPSRRARARRPQSRARSIRARRSCQRRRRRE